MKYLIYEVVLTSAAEQSDSVLHTDTFFFTVLTIMVYPRTLNTVPSAIQQNSIVYSLYVISYDKP